MPREAEAGEGGEGETEDGVAEVEERGVWRGAEDGALA